MREHIVLLGDSVFDNKAYVGNSPDVITHLKQMLPDGYSATLCAVDGDVISNIKDQIREVPEDATCIFVSVGGNDALMHMNILSDESRSGPAALKQLSTVANFFHDRYSEAIDLVCNIGKPIHLFTIYNGDLDTNITVAARAAVSVFNDKIYSVANYNNLSVIELRRICNLPEDFIDKIEPSAIGGKKIATAIHERIMKEQGK